MRCNQCGNEISNNTPFCPYCGAAQTPPAEAVPPVQETPAVEETAPVQEATPAVKKKKPVLRWAVIVATVAAVAALAIIFGNNIINSLMPADKRLQDTYVSLVEDAVKDLNFDGLQKAMEAVGSAGSLGSAGAMQDMNATLSSSMELELSPNLITLLGGVNDPGIHKVGLDYDMILDSGKIGMDMALSAEETEIAQIILYMDMANGRMVLEAPGLISMPVEMSLATDDYDSAYGYDSYYDYGSAENSLNSVIEMLSAMDWSFLSEDAVKALLPRLVEVALADLEVEKENDAFSAAGVEQKATCLQVKFSEKTVQKMLVALLKELKENEDVKTLLKDFYNKNADVFDLDYYGSASDFYKSFKELLNMALSSVREGEASKETVVTLSTWINSDNKILALELKADETKIFLGTAKKGKETGFELSVKADGEETMSLELSGETEKDVYNGKLVLSANGMDIVTVDCKDMDLARCEEGDLNGTFTLKPGKEIMADQDAPTDIALVMELDGNKVEMDVRINGASMATLKSSFSMKESGTVDIPDNTMDYNNIAGYEQYYINIDLLIQRLEQAGLHPDLVQMMRNSLQ